jgi:hypothetical protein
MQPDNQNLPYQCGSDNLPVMVVGREKQRQRRGATAREGQERGAAHM